MKSLSDILKIGSLIGKYLTDKESPKELEELNEWIDQGEENKSLYNSIKDEKQLASSIQDFDRFDTEAAWNKYHEAISQRSKKVLYFRWRVVASILVIVTLSTIVLLKHFPGKDLEVVKVTPTITPGEPKAFIELSSGTKYDLQNLTERQQGKLEKDAGIVVEGNTVVNSKKVKSKRIPELLAVVTPRGGEYKVLLDDGTQVWLNADSRLEFPDAFSGEERKVKLSGEAYFDVAKDHERPFIVSVDNMDVEVLGTEFNISAYNNDAQIQTTLVEGEVAVKSKSASDYIQKILSLGEQAELIKGKDVIEIRKVEVSQYIAWKDGKFVFDYQTLGEITKILERWYDVDFIFTNDELRETPFSGEFLRYDNIENVYDIIRKTGTKIEFKQEGRTIEIRN